MNRVLQLKTALDEHLRCGARQLTRLSIDIPPFLGEKGARVDQEGLLLTRKCGGNS